MAGGPADNEALRASRAVPGLESQMQGLGGGMAEAECGHEARMCVLRHAQAHGHHLGVTLHMCV